MVVESVRSRSTQGGRRRHSDTLSRSFEEYRDMVGWEGMRQTHAHIDRGTSICAHTHTHTPGTMKFTQSTCTNNEMKAGKPGGGEVSFWLDLQRQTQARIRSSLTDGVDKLCSYRFSASGQFILLVNRDSP